MTLNLPPDAGPAREDAILQAFKNGHISNEWAAIDIIYQDNTATFFVTKDALKIDGVRINVTAATQQKIADEMCCILPTAKLADHIFAHADVIVKPKPRKITSTTKAMIEHSAEIDKDVAGRKGLIATTGKHWILDELLSRPRVPNQAINYGWHFKGPMIGIKGDPPVCYKTFPDVRLIQSRGSFHNFVHTDYSQTCTLVARECEVNGKAMDILDLLKDPKLAFLASHSGPLPILRQPGVPDPGYLVVVPDQIGIRSTKINQT